MKITLVGMGMGNGCTTTLEARAALADATVVIGSERLFTALGDECSAECIPLAVPDKIAAAVAEHPEWERVCVVLSGDVGFYSGAKRLLVLLAEHNPGIICGISTPQYFAARLRRPWQDLRLVSAHGVSCDVLAEVLNHPAVLFLVGGTATPAGIARELCDAGLDDAIVTVAENLGAKDEEIHRATAGLMEDKAFASLSVVLVENKKTFTRDMVGGGIEDDAFVRGDAPMTKREVRAAALGLLHMRADSVLYDIGAGTGSVAVEMALAARRGRVFAVETDADACRLIDVNREAFGTYNIRTVCGIAPDALVPLPPPDAAFIGGSKNRLDGIIDSLLAKNPAVRVVISAITLETLSAALDAMHSRNLRDVEVCQIAANRAVARGSYHMLTAMNPVFLISGGGPGGE